MRWPSDEWVDPGAGFLQAMPSCPNSVPFAVRDLLKIVGVPEDRIDLKKPEDIKAGATSDEQGADVFVALTLGNAKVMAGAPSVCSMRESSATILHSRPARLQGHATPH